MRKLLLISDANILIDLEEGQLTPALFQLSHEIAVPDILFESELREMHSHLLTLGLKIKSLTAESVQKAQELVARYPRPSRIDHIALALAIQQGCPLLTGDRDLRAAAGKEGIEVHGTIWIIEQLLNQKLIQQAQARLSFDQMRVNGRRLPWGDVEGLLNRWELIGAL